MTDAEFLERFTRHATGGSFYVREKETGKRTRLYITLNACKCKAEEGELYTDAEYQRLTAMPVGAAPRRAIKSKRAA